MENFFLSFTVVLFLSAIFINGFFNTTRGEWVIHPDGTKTYEGMIFKFWSKLLQTHYEKKFYYSGTQFYRKVASILARLPEGALKEAGPNYFRADFGMNELEMLGAFENETDALDSTQESPTLLLVKAYKKEKQYVIPEIIRMPFGGCITCMASVYGTICWIFWVHVPAFAHTLTGISFLGKCGLWIFFCVSLAWINEVIFNINHKLKK